MQARLVQSNENEERKSDTEYSISAENIKTWHETENMNMKREHHIKGNLLLM